MVVVEFLRRNLWILPVMTGIATWVFNNIVSVLVSELPAPTATSSVKYIYWFKVSNRFIGNVARAKSTSIEQSPNFQAAVVKQIQILQNMPTMVQAAKQVGQVSEARIEMANQPSKPYGEVDPKA